MERFWLASQQTTHLIHRLCFSPIGLRANRYDSIICLLFFCLISCSVSFQDADSFDGLVRKYANDSLSNPRTGVVYNITLPSNLSGIHVSYIRLSSISFWVRGENLSWISIPPRVTLVPIVKRIALVFENLGNWSSSFYNAPGYTLVAPVIGFTVYDSSSNSTTLGHRKLDLLFMGTRKYILVRFPKLKLGEKGMKKKKRPLCVMFGANGSFILMNMTKPNLCSVSDCGYFSLVIEKEEEEEKGVLWEWWVIGFGCGLVGLGLVGLVLMTVLRLKRKNIKVMERESEREVSFDTVWIGKSKMPSASMVRTQPALENSYIP